MVEIYFKGIEAIKMFEEFFIIQVNAIIKQKTLFDEVIEFNKSRKT